MSFLLCQQFIKYRSLLYDVSKCYYSCLVAGVLNALYLFFFLFAHFALWMLIGSLPEDMFFAVADHVSGQLNNMSASNVCFACPAWLYELFVRMLISLLNTYASCGRPTLHFLERFDFGLLHSDWNEWKWKWKNKFSKHMAWPLKWQPFSLVFQGGSGPNAWCAVG